MKNLSKLKDFPDFPHLPGGPDLPRVKKGEPVEKNGQGAEGFTLIEVLVSLVIILMAVIFISRVIMYSLDGLRKSAIRLEMTQTLESQANRLMPLPFYAPDLDSGAAVFKEGEFFIRRQVNHLSPTLKRVDLAVSYDVLTLRFYFYKSKHFSSVPGK